MNRRWVGDQSLEFCEGSHLAPVVGVRGLKGVIMSYLILVRPGLFIWPKRRRVPIDIPIFVQRVRPRTHPLEIILLGVLNIPWLLFYILGMPIGIIHISNVLWVGRDCMPDC